MPGNAEKHHDGRGVVGSSHNHTVFVFPAFFEFALFRRRSECLARCCSLDDGKALFCSLVSVVGSFYVPDIGFKWITAAADTHLCEVSTGIFGFGKPCIQLACQTSLDHGIHVPCSAALFAHSYASFSSFSKTGSAPTMYQAHKFIIASGISAWAAQL